MTSEILGKPCIPHGRNPYWLISRRELGNVNNSHQFMRLKTKFANNLYRRELKSHFGCVNAIEFSQRGGQFFASGGDDRRVLLWNVEKALSDIGSPQTMKGEHNSNIFCLAFDHENKKIFSGGNDEQVVVHDIESGSTLDVFAHENAVYGLSSDPINGSVFASACDDGRILVYDIREPPSSEPFCLANYTSSMHSVAYNPVEPRLLATANAKEGIGLWDIRKPRSCLLRYGSGLVQQSCMSICVSKMGDRLLALRRRLPPVLYDIKSPTPLCEFDHAGYYNSCTMKSCSFAGDKDQYVLSGSDDCNLYMWKIPDDLSQRQFVTDAHMVLHGHRSIVNQVRFNDASHLILSSGVEKSIKVWSPFPIPKSEGGLYRESLKNTDRQAYSHEDYINLVLQTGNVMTHDYSSQSVEEDPRMLAFFDSLVQRELEGFSSSDDLASSEEEFLDRIQNLTGSDISDSDSDNSENLPQPRTVRNNRECDDSSANPFTIAFASTANGRSQDGVSGLYNEVIESSDSESESDAEDESSRGRKTVESLIKQRRKISMLNGVNKRKRPLVTYTSDSSDSENEDKSSTGNSTDNNEPVHGHPFNAVSACKQRNNLKLKRLKLLRENLLKSDSDTTESHGEEKNIISKETETEKTKVDENPKINKSEGEKGPYLHEAENQPSCSKPVPNPSSTNSSKHVDKKEEIVDLEENRQNGTEFKRFKKGVKSRKYRSHSNDDNK